MPKILFAMDISVVVMESILVFWVMHSLFIQKCEKKMTLLFYSVAIVGVWLLTYKQHWAIKGGVQLVLQAMLALIFFQGNKRSKIFITWGISMIVLITDGLIAMLAYFLGYKSVVEQSSIDHFVLAVSSRIICASILGVFVLFFRAKILGLKEQMERRYVIGLSTVPILTALIFIVAYRFIETNGRNVAFAFCAFFTILMYFLSMNVQMKNLQVLEYQNRESYERKENALRKENYENAQKLHKEIYKMAHDLKHHILVLKGLYEHSKEAEQYIKAIEKELEYHLEEHSFGNLIVETVIREYASSAELKGIHVDLEIDAYNEIEIDMIDLANVLGNAFENVIEACERIKEGDILKIIKCTVTMKNDQLWFSIENPVDSYVQKRGKRYLTSKTDQTLHGIGMLSMEKQCGNTMECCTQKLKTEYLS